MSQKVIFNGKLLVKPGGATRVDASLMALFGVSGNGVVGLVGEADAGETGVVYIFDNAPSARRVFKGGPLMDAVDLAFSKPSDNNLPGAAQRVVCVVTNATAGSEIVLKDDAAADSIKVSSRDRGAHTKKIGIKVADVGGGKQFTVRYDDALGGFEETSPVLAGTGEVKIEYVGNGSAATATVTATHLTTAVTGASDGSANLNVDFATFKTVADLISYVNAQTGYKATALGGSNPYGTKSTDLDPAAAVNIKAAGGASLFAKMARVLEWFNTSSQLVQAERVGSATKLPVAVPTFRYLAGGTHGGSTNQTWQDALDLLGTLRVNQVVPCLSEDVTDNGSTATFESVAMATDAHVAHYTATGGNNERHAFIGMKGTKTQILDLAAKLNSHDTTLVGQYPTVLLPRGLTPMPAWAFAVCAAAARAGADLGEPLTHKYLRFTDLTQDASWNPGDDGVTMILGGVMIAEKVPNKGIRVVKGITTYTREDNDAFTEESIVQVWKALTYDLRTTIEERYTGRKGSFASPDAVVGTINEVCSKYAEQGYIVGSTLEDGTVLEPWREQSAVSSGDKVEWSVVASPVPGVNFTLGSIFLVPAQNRA